MSDFVGNMERARMADAVADLLLNGDPETAKRIPLVNLSILAKRYVERGQIIEAMKKARRQSAESL